MSSAVSSHPQAVPDAIAGRAVGVVPGELSPELNSVLNSVQLFVRANTWEELNAALARFDDDAKLDVPVLFVPGKQRMRAINALVAFFVERDLEPKVVYARLQGADKAFAELQIDGTMHVHPRRRWYLPLTYLLPNDIPVDTTVTVRVKGWNDKIALLQGRAHNLPTFPYILRWLYGFGFGTVGVFMQPIVARIIDLASASWVTGSETAERISTSGPVEAVKSAAASAASTVSGTVGAVTGTVSDTIGAVKDRAAELAGQGLAAVQDTAQGALGRAEGTYSSMTGAGGKHAQHMQQAPHEAYPSGVVA